MPPFFRGHCTVNDTNQPVGADAPEFSSGVERGASSALAAAEAKATEFRDSYLRAVAELENYRKRTEREIDNARKFAIERFAQELVTVGDALEAGINAGSANPGPALLEGAQATLRQLQRAFEFSWMNIIYPFFLCFVGYLNYLIVCLYIGLNLCI